MPDVIRITSLDDSRAVAYRDVASPQRLIEQSLFVAEGRLVVRRLLELRQWQIESLLLTEPAANSLADVLDATPAPIYLVDQPLMNDLAGFNIHRGCLALVRRPDAGTLDRIVAGPMARVLVLEGVNNPDNVGGLFRSAAAFDIDLVVLGPDCGDPLYRKAIRTSMAATLSVPFVQAAQWPGAIRELRADGFTVAALTPSRLASPLEDVFPHSKLALLVGSEGTGLTPAAMQAATIRIRVPTTADVDSLNVTVAASIAMYHCFAERRV